MFAQMMLLNQLGSVDVGFFVGCAIAIALIVAVYFLIPVFNKKQYKEQRDNLKKREEAFRSSKGISAVKDDGSAAANEGVSACENEESGIENVTNDSQDERTDDIEG